MINGLPELPASAAFNKLNTMECGSPFHRSIQIKSPTRGGAQGARHCPYLIQ